MPFCTYCGSSFSRDEHLERHILTHTNVKPYKCLTCHMSFARRDLLQRHYVVHGKDADNEPLVGPNGLLTKPGGRTPIACHNCAKTKTKCDKKFPCSRCASRNLTCTVRPTRRATKNGAIAQRLEEQSRADSHEESSSSSSAEGASRSPTSGSAPHSRGSDSSAYQRNASWEDFTSTTGSRHHAHNLSIPEAQMSSISFDDNTPLSERDTFLEMDIGPDGYAIPLPSPLLPEGQTMFDWSQMPFQLDNNNNFFNPHDPYYASQPSSFVPNVYHNQLDEFYDPQHQSNGNTAEKAPILASPHDHITLPDTRPSVEAQDPLTTVGALQHADPAVIEALAAAHDAWSVFRCNPCVPSHECPKTARLNLETLEQSLGNEELWAAYTPQWQEGITPGLEQMDVEPLNERLRDKLLAITQSFLHKALDTHDHDVNVTQSRLSSKVVLLPPARVLHLFLLTYTRSFEQYYSITPRSLLDVNELMKLNNDRAAALLILLMIAQGASVTPGEGQSLTAGITEACRISLFDVVEKNIMMASDHVVLHSALLFTVQATWSGDKWQMDIATGQRGMYINMLRHSGRLEPRTPMAQSMDPIETDRLWETWIEQESRSRLIYAWVSVDQEASLFHDTATMFAVTEIGEPLPSSDALWHASSANTWAREFESLYEYPSNVMSTGPNNRPLSLRGLFRHFLDDGIVSKRVELTPLHLRLLLQPLQSLVHQARQLLSCFPDKTAARRGSKSVTAASTRVQLKETSTLLQRWYGLADRYLRTKPMCPLMRSNLIIFHLISLNAVSNFPEIERLARRDESELSDQHLPSLHKRCITDSEEAIVHCGQILRLVRSMSPTIRPPWWAAAIYRVALVLWTVSLNSGDSPSGEARNYVTWETSFVVDVHPPQHPLIAQYLAEKQGTPLLTRTDGSQMPITDPLSLLLHCTQVIAEGIATRFTDGLRLKLSRLAKDGSR